jgi:hypothetical protein
MRQLSERVGIAIPSLADELDHGDWHEADARRRATLIQ